MISRRTRPHALECVGGRCVQAQPSSAATIPLTLVPRARTAMSKRTESDGRLSHSRLFRGRRRTRRCTWQSASRPAGERHTVSRTGTFVASGLSPGCLLVVIRPITQVVAVVLCLGITVPAVPAGNRSSRLRCFTVSPGLRLVDQDVEDIIAAVRRNSGRPVLTIEPPDFSDYAPAGVVQVVILTSGACDGGCKERIWIRKGKRGWRVFKKLGGGECWFTIASATARRLTSR